MLLRREVENPRRHDPFVQVRLPELHYPRATPCDIVVKHVRDALPEFERQIKKYLIYFGNRGEVLDDLAQEVVVRLYLNRNGLYGKGTQVMKGWIRTVCRNLHVDTCRRNHRNYRRLPKNKDSAFEPRSNGGSLAVTQRTIETLDLEDVPSLESDPELREILDHCIEKLPERHQSMFELRYLLGLPNSEIAALFKKGIRLIQTELKRTRHSLADCLRFHGYTIET